MSNEALDAGSQVVTAVYNVFIKEATRIKSLIDSGSLPNNFPDELREFAKFAELVLDLYGYLPRR